MTRIVTGRAGEIGVDPEIGTMIGIIDEEVARENIEAGEMIPATGSGDGQMILLT